MMKQKDQMDFQIKDLGFKPIEASIPFRYGCLLFAVILLVIAPWGSRAWAQRNFRAMPMMEPEGVLMPSPREVQSLLSDAKSNIKNSQWTEATFVLGLLLGLESPDDSDLSGVDYFLGEEETAGAESSTGKTGTVFKTVFDLIESLPVEATKFIDLRYGVKASQLLEQAVANSDWRTMEKVAGRYSFTTAGQDACVILGEYWLRNGNPLAASRFFSIAFRQKSALIRLGPEIGLLTASSMDAAGLSKEAVKCLDITRAQFNKVAIDWKGTKISWDSRATPIVSSREILDSLRTKAGDAGQTKELDRIVRQPWYLGGDPSRNADTTAGTPMPILRWHTELHESKQHKDNLAVALKEKIQDKKLTFIPSRFPISVGPWIITSTYDQRIIAVDAKTGRLGWECLYSGMPLGFSMERFANRESNPMNLSAPDYLTKRVWGENVVGMPSSDGKRIFSISELPAVDVAESFALGQNARVSKPQEMRGFNVLQSWSVAEEGKIQWEVGGVKSPIEPSLAGVLFLGPPLPHNGELFVMGELNSDVYLFSISPETGKMNWRQPFASNYTSISRDELRRNVGASPAADGSILVCPTLSGHLIAFDTVSRSLLWTFDYPLTNTGSIGQVGQFGQVDRGDFQPMMGRSAESSLTIHSGVAYFAPPDGEGIVAISIADGKVLWNTSADRKGTSGRPMVPTDNVVNEKPSNAIEQVRYVAGVWNELAIVVCQSSIFAVETKKFSTVWTLDLPSPSQLAGRGVRKGGMYFLPTTDQEILQIDLATGAITEKVHVDQPLGNLVAVGDRLVCASPFQLDCYAIREAFQSELKEDLQKNSISRSGLTRQAELALAKGDFEEALQFLEKAKKLEPDNAEVLILLNKVGMAALTSDFDKYVDRVVLAQDLAFDRERMPYLRLVAQGLERQGRYLESMTKLLEMSDLRIGQRQEQTAGRDMFSQSKESQVQQDQWIASKIRRCFEKLKPAEVAKLQPELDARLDALRKLPPNARRLKLEHMEGIPNTLVKSMEVAKELIQQRDLLRAERLIRKNLQAMSNSGASPENLVREANKLLAEVYVRGVRFDLALSHLNGDVDQLRRMIDEISEPSQFMIGGELELPTPEKTAKAIGDWPTGKVDVAITRQIANAPLQQAMLETQALCKWKTRIGDALKNWTVSMGQGNWVFASSDGKRQFQLYEDVGTQEKGTVPIIHSVDSIAIVEMNRQLFAVNTLMAANSEQDAVLWREPFDGNSPEIERGRGRVAAIERNSWGLPIQRKAMRVVSLTRSGIIVAHDDNLICFDLLSGAKLWALNGCKDCSYAEGPNKLHMYQPLAKTVSHIDTQDGTSDSPFPVATQGWKCINSIGKYFLMASTDTKQYGLQLMDSSDGRIVFTKTFSADTRLALNGQESLVALSGSGELTFWNLQEEKETVSKVQVEGAFGSINVQRFGDTLLVLPFAVSQGLDSIAVWPDQSDPAFLPVAGRIVAISAKDGSQVWKQNNMTKTIFFPLAQARNAPVVVFVRRLTLSKVAGVDPDLLSVAVLDIRDGQIVYARDDLPAIRNLGFSETVDSESNKVRISFLGTTLTLTWSRTDSNENGTVPSDQQFDFGDIDYRAFRQAIEEKLLQSQDPKPAPKDESEMPDDGLDIE